MKRLSNFSPFLAIIHNCLASLFATAIMTTFFGFLAKIEETKQLDKDGEAALSAAIADFKKSGAY